MSWFFMYAAIAAVMLGGIGKGVLSHTVLHSEEGLLRIDYERFMRYRSADELHIVVRSPRDRVRLSFNTPYFNRIGVQRILPEPAETLMTADTVTLTFKNTPSEPAVVRLTISPDRIGSQRGWISIDGGPRHTFNQFVYP